jgi:hypothetical protein
MPPRRRRWYEHLLGGLFGTALLVGLALVAVLQLPAFRSWLLQLLLDRVNSELNGHLSVASVQLDGLSAIELHQVLLLDPAGDTLAYVPRLSVAYEVFALARRRIVVPTVSLDHALFRFVRGADSLWNFERLARRRTSTSEPPDISIWLRGVRLHSATIVVVDSLRSAPTDFLHRGQWLFRNVELTASAALFPRQRRFFASLRSLHFQEPESGLSVQELRGHFAVTPHEVRAEEFRLRLPGAGVRATLRATLSDTLGRSRDNPIRLIKELAGTVTVDSLVPQRLTRWVPQLPAIAETLTATVSVSGTAQQLQLNPLRLSLGKAHLHARLTLHEPFREDQRRISGNVESSALPIALLAQLLPDFPEQARPLGFVQIRSSAFILSPRTATVQAQLLTAQGRVRLSTRVQWDKPSQPRYSLQLASDGFAVGVFLPVRRPILVAGRLELEGSGETLEESSLRVRGTVSGGHIGTLSLQESRLVARLDKGFLQLDTLALRLLHSDTAVATASGWLQLLPATMPSYRLHLSLSQFPLATVVGDTALPQLVSLTAQVAGRGLHPDSLEAFVQASIGQLEYPDWTLLPFQLSVQLTRPSLSARFFQLSGEPFRVQLTGQWRPTTLPSLAQGLGVAISRWLAQKTRFLPTPVALPVPLPLSDTADVRFRIELRDLEWLRYWTQPLTLRGSLLLDGRLTVAADTAVLQLDQLFGRFLSAAWDTVQLHGERLQLRALAAHFRIADMVPELTSLRGILWLDLLRWSASTLDSLQLRWDFAADSGTAELRLSFPELFSLHWRGEERETREHILLTTTHLEALHFGSGFRWNSSLPFRIRLSSSGITLDTAVLQRQDKETLRFYGHLTTDSLQLHAELLHARLEDLLVLLPLELQRPELLSLRGQLDTLHLVAFGPMKTPSAELQLRISRLRYDTIPIGTAQLSAQLSDGVLRGTALVEEGTRWLRLQVLSLPSRRELFARIPARLVLQAHNISASVLAPFVPELRNLSGSVSMDIAVEGTMPLDLQLNGTIRSEAFAFQVAQTAVPYRASFLLRFRQQQLRVEHFTLHNLPEDLPNGTATLTGTIGLRELRPWTFDLEFRSPQLLVLSYASARANPSFYGTLIIGTGPSALHLHGTWEQPRLTGELFIRTARLLFPAPASAVAAPPSLLAEYHWISSSPLALPTPEASSPAAPTLRAEPGFAARLVYDVRVYLVGPFSITMDLAPTQQLIAELAAENPSVPLAYVTGPEGIPQLLGRLRLGPGSVYRFYRNFTATGTISFTTGEIDNPELDIEVRYQGSRIFNNQRQNYEIRFTIRGTRRNLSIGNWSYTIAGTAGTGDENKLFNDVVWLLLLGRTQEELESSVSASSEIGREVPLANLSTLASKAATELFRGIGIVQDVQIDPTTGTFDIEQMRARITGQLGGITVRWGGTVGNPLQQAEFTVEMPLSELLRGEPEFLRQVLLQLSTTTGSTTVALPSTQRLWEVRISVRF